MTIIEQDQQVDFGMPASARLRVTAPRALPITPECSVPGALGGRAIAGHVSDDRSATNGLVVFTDAPWGTPAWSPPRW